MMALLLQLLLLAHGHASPAPRRQAPLRGPAEATIIVVFIPVAQTSGLFYHAFLLFFNAENMGVARGAYKTEALGGGSRNIIGIPSIISPSAPHAVTANAELAEASRQECHYPAYLFPPWAACSWRKFSISLPTSMRVDRLLGSFAQTARCFSAHPVGYHPFGPNTNTYAYTALLNAGMEPGDAPGAVVAPGWGTEIHSSCTLH
jgi:hypothetical protein